MSLPKIKLNLSNSIQGETNPLIESSIILRVSNNLNTGLLSKTDILELLNYDDCINIEYLGLNKLILSVNMNIIGSESIEYYACELLNLPTVVEVYKSIDNGKNMLKNNNINQVIYIHKKINKYEDIFNIKVDHLNSELINEDSNKDPIYTDYHEKDYKEIVQLYDNLKKVDFKNNKKYDLILKNINQKNLINHSNILKNGLTPPLHNVVKRRQRRQLSLNQIKKLEYTLNKLVQNDLLSESVEYEFISESEIDNDKSEEHHNNVTVANDDHLKNQLKNVIQQQKDEESEESDLELELEKVLLEQDEADEPLEEQAVVEQDEQDDEQDEEQEEEDNQQNDFDEDDELTLLIDELKSLQNVKQTNLKSFHNCKNQFMKERILERIKKIDKEIEVIENKIKNMKQEDEGDGEDEEEEEDEDIDGLFSDEEPENEANEGEKEQSEQVEEPKANTVEKDSDYYESDDDMLELFGGSENEE